MKKEELKVYLLYIPSIGKFAAKKDMPPKIKEGDIVGSKAQHGYEKVSINNNTYYIHRLVWLYHYGEMPKTIDHINRIRDDNRLENLRAVTRSENSQNIGIRNTNKSGYQSISKSPNSNSFIIQKTIKGIRMSASARTIEEALAIRSSMLNGTFDGYSKQNGHFKNA